MSIAREAASWSKRVALPLPAKPKRTVKFIEVGEVESVGEDPSRRYVCVTRFRRNVDIKLLAHPKRIDIRRQFVDHLQHPRIDQLARSSR